MLLGPIKKCAECQEEKPKTEFGKTSKYCRPCAGIRKKQSLKRAQQRYVEAHPDRVTARNKDFYAANREREKLALSRGVMKILNNAKKRQRRGAKRIKSSSPKCGMLGLKRTKNIAVNTAVINMNLNASRN
jgi:hypothetical protein